VSALGALLVFGIGFCLGLVVGLTIEIRDLRRIKEALDRGEKVNL